jgi:carbon storage regulator CsrA
MGSALAARAISSLTFVPQSNGVFVMLVLTRKLQQQIKIGEQITVTILRVKGSTVRVGVQAPREVRVIRGELPKEAQAVEDSASEEGTIIEFRVPVEALADRGAEAEVQSNDEAAAPAAHLPLRRIRNRHGSGPLKQVRASAALAK